MGTWVHGCMGIGCSRGVSGCSRGRKQDSPVTGASCKKCAHQNAARMRLHGLGRVNHRYPDPGGVTRFDFVPADSLRAVEFRRRLQPADAHALARERGDVNEGEKIPRAPVAVALVELQVAVVGDGLECLLLAAKGGGAAHRHGRQGPLGANPLEVEVNLEPELLAEGLHRLAEVSADGAGVGGLRPEAVQDVAAAEELSGFRRALVGGGVEGEIEHFEGRAAEGKSGRR